MDIHPNPGPPFDHISIFHINIRSLRNKVDYLSDIASDYDIVCVTETHLDEYVLNSDIYIEGFYPDPIRVDRTCHGGGILIYVSEQLLVNRMNRFEFDVGENIWLEVKFPHYSFLLCTVYRSPTCNNEFWNRLNNSIDDASNYNPHIVLINGRKLHLQQS